MRLYNVIVLFAVLTCFSAPQAVRADTTGQWLAQHRPLRITTNVFRAAAIGLTLSAITLETAMLMQYRRGAPTPSYDRMMRVTGPLSGIGSVFAVVSIPLGAAAYERELPDGVDAAVFVVGLACMLTGVVLWASAADRLGTSSYREPVHPGGSVLFSAGLPLSLWGAGNMYFKALGRAYHH